MIEFLEPAVALSKTFEPAYDLTGDVVWMLRQGIAVAAFLLPTAFALTFGGGVGIALVEALFGGGEDGE